MKKTVKLTENDLHKLIKETVNKILNENASKYLYHYINGENLIQLLKRNSMKTCKPEIYIDSFFNDEKYHYIDGENQRFLSFTRNGNAKEGYPILKYGGYGDGEDNFMCRLTIDGDFFNNGNIKKYDKRYKKGYQRIKTKFKPIDWAYYDVAQGGDIYSMADETNGIFAHNGKEWQMQSDSHDYYYPIKDDATDLYNHPMSQAEDRLTTTAKYIPQANKYILRIDIFITENINNEDKFIINQILKYATKLNIQVKIFDNFDKFCYDKK